MKNLMDIMRMGDGIKINSDGKAEIVSGEDIAKLLGGTFSSVDDKVDLDNLEDGIGGEIADFLNKEEPLSKIAPLPNNNDLTCKNEIIYVEFENKDIPRFSKNEDLNNIKQWLSFTFYNGLKEKFMVMDYFKNSNGNWEVETNVILDEEVVFKSELKSFVIEASENFNVLSEAGFEVNEIVPYELHKDKYNTVFGKFEVVYTLLPYRGDK